jgi:hypothetical protein
MAQMAQIEPNRVRSPRSRRKAANRTHDGRLKRAIANALRSLDPAVVRPIPAPVFDRRSGASRYLCHLCHLRPVY